MVLRRLSLVLVAAAMGIVGGLFASDALADQHLKPQPPFSRGSDDEYAQSIEAGRQRRVQFTRDFVAQGRDPRSLPKVVVSRGYDRGPRTLEAAVAASHLVVAGVVLRTSFTPDDSGSFPKALSLVRVTDVIKGGSVGQVVVRQLGGPELGPTGGILSQTDTDELLLPGDEVVLLLKDFTGAHHTVAASGIYFIQGGRVVPEHVNPFGDSLAGKSKDELIAALKGAVR